MPCTLPPNLDEGHAQLGVRPPNRAAASARAIDDDIKLLRQAERCRHRQAGALLGNVADGAVKLGRLFGQRNLRPSENALARPHSSFCWNGAHGGSVANLQIIEIKIHCKSRRSLNLFRKITGIACGVC